MIKRFLIISLFVIPVQVMAQPNLVPNPDLEYYTSCPWGFYQIDLAYPWSEPIKPQNYTYYLNSCATYWPVDVPNNLFGFQYPRSGDGYAGLINYLPPVGHNYRHYMEIKLNDSLQNGKEYCVTFYLSLADKSQYATDAIGAYFSHDTVNVISPPDPLLISVIPQFENPPGNIILDTVEWVRVSGSFIASGGEYYLTIGNFRDDNSTNIVQFNPSGVNNYAYYYIDDISVKLGACVTSLNESESTNQVVFYPNPTTGQVYFKGFIEAFFEVSDLSGRVILRNYFKDQLDLSLLENGIYFIRAINQRGVASFQKVILNK